MVRTRFEGRTREAGSGKYRFPLTCTDQSQGPKAERKCWKGGLVFQSLDSRSQTWAQNLGSVQHSGLGILL